MEKEIKIKTADNHFIYGKTSGSSRQSLFIVVHGLPGSMDEDLYVEAARWFAKHGYATFRFNLYGAEKGARQLMGSTLKTHAADIDTVVRHFRKKGFKKICLAGHSYGCPSILLSQEQVFDSVVLWDPSYKISFTKKNPGTVSAQYLKEAKGYLMSWGVNFIIGEDMANEADALKWNTLTKDFNVPFRIIAAGKGILLTGAKHYGKVASTPNDLVVLKEATHYFNDKDDMREKLFKATDAWFKKDRKLHLR